MSKRDEHGASEFGIRVVVARFASRGIDGKCQTWEADV